MKHITAKLDAIWQNRTIQMRLVLRQPDGGTVTLTVNGIFKLIQDEDPTIFVQQGLDSIHNADAVALLKTDDITLSQIRGCMYLEPQTTWGSSIVTRYLVTGVAMKGMLPGGDRYVLSLDRQR
jgi:hypothetical protein